MSDFISYKKQNKYKYAVLDDIDYATAEFISDIDGGNAETVISNYILDYADLSSVDEIIFKSNISIDEKFNLSKVNLIDIEIVNDKLKLRAGDIEVACLLDDVVSIENELGMKHEI